MVLRPPFVESRTIPTTAQVRHEARAQGRAVSEALYVQYPAARRTSFFILGSSEPDVLVPKSKGPQAARDALPTALVGVIVPIILGRLVVVPVAIIDGSVAPASTIVTLMLSVQCGLLGSGAQALIGQ